MYNNLVCKALRDLREIIKHEAVQNAFNPFKKVEMLVICYKTVGLKNA